VTARVPRRYEGLRVAPVTRDGAFAWVRQHHSTNPVPPASWLTGCAVYAGGELVCVAILGRPTARRLHDGRTAEVTRCASDGRAEHAASMALAAITRAAVALGYRRLVSYRLLGEAGASYRGAGWRVTGLTRAEEWSRPSRARKPAAQPGRKARWEYGPEAGALDHEADAVVRAEHERAKREAVA
jgi:hypothetical protein